MAQNIPKTAIIHHSADDSPGCQLEKINRHHKSKGFPKSSLGWHVGYHRVGCDVHDTHKTREDFEYGAHDRGENINTISYCMPGNYDVFYPSKRIKAQLGLMLTYWIYTYKISVTDIEPHRKHDVGYKCYGSNLSDHWAQYAYLYYNFNIIRRPLAWLSVELSKIV